MRSPGRPDVAAHRRCRSCIAFQSQSVRTNQILPAISIIYVAAPSCRGRRGIYAEPEVDVRVACGRVGCDRGMRGVDRGGARGRMRIQAGRAIPGGAALVLHDRSHHQSPVLVPRAGRPCGPQHRAGTIGAVNAVNAIGASHIGDAAERDNAHDNSSGPTGSADRTGRAADRSDSTGGPGRRTDRGDRATAGDRAAGHGARGPGDRAVHSVAAARGCGRSRRAAARRAVAHRASHVRAAATHDGATAAGLDGEHDPPARYACTGRRSPVRAAEPARGPRARSDGVDRAAVTHSRGGSLLRADRARGIGAHHRGTPGDHVAGEPLDRPRQKPCARSACGSMMY